MSDECTPTTDKIGTHSMNDYAPSMDEIRAGWVMYSTWKRVPTCGRVQAEAEFDRWLAEHDREVAVASAKQALEDAADDWHAEHEGTRPVPYIWLVRRAASFSADPEGATK